MSGDDWFWVSCVGAAVAWAIFLWRFAETAFAAPAPPPPVASSPMTLLSYEEDDAIDPTRVVRPKAKTSAAPIHRIVVDDAAAKEPSAAEAPLSLDIAGKTDAGLHRKQNQDEMLLLRDQNVFAVADGIGGDRGGALASKLATLTIERAFRTSSFDGPRHEELPQHASELACAIHMANAEVFARAAQDAALEGMGTTICAARFVEGARRLYIGHVGDSRLYRLREGALSCLTTDHTVPAGKSEAGRLERAVGISSGIPIDVVLEKPRAGDVYLLCTDGLTKMIDDAAIATALRDDAAETAASALVAAAKANGGKDNVTVVVVRVRA